MLILRIVVIATAAALAAMVLAWLFTGERAWLTRAWLAFRIALCVIVLILLLFAAEHALAG